MLHEICIRIDKIFAFFEVLIFRTVGNMTNVINNQAAAIPDTVET